MFALILAGGMGERLRPLTDTLPKPMVPVCGKPILQHQVEWLRAAGITDVVFLAGYRWEAIQEHFGDGREFGIRVTYSVEESPLGRGGAIRRGLSSIPADAPPVVVLNGDTITTQRLGDLVDRHQNALIRNPAHLVTMMLVPMVSPYGLVDVTPTDDVVGFREKAELPYWINAGIYVFESEVASELPEVGDHEVETFPKLAQEGRISALKSTAFWRGIDSFKDLREVEDRLCRSEEQVAPTGLTSP